MPIQHVDRAIDGLARRQHGVFHLRQAVRLGATRAMRRSRLANGRWVRLAGSEVFALPSHPGTWLRQCMAATLSVPAGAVSGAAAAALHGFPDWKRSRIEVATRRQTTHRSPFADVRTTSTIGRLMVVDGIRVVSPADCLVQVAALYDDPQRYLGIVDDAARDRRHLREELTERYAALAHSRLPGIGNVRAAVEAIGGGHVPTASELDRRLRTLLASVSLPGPALFEATPPWTEAGAQRVDALVPACTLIVEADGRAWHTRVRDFERDRERDSVALAHGHATLRFTWHQLTRRPAWCRNVLSAVVADRRGSDVHHAAA